MHKLPTHLLIFVALILTTFSKPTTTTFETKANGQSLTKNEETIHKCNDIIATTSIAVHTNINLKQHFKITGSIEDWEEEYDDWETEDEDEDEVKDEDNKVISTATSSTDTTETHEENQTGIQLTLSMHEREDPYSAALGFITLYGLERKEMNHLAERLLEYVAERNNANTKNPAIAPTIPTTPTSTTLNSCKILLQFYVKSILVTQYESETIAHSIRRYASEIIKQRRDAKDYPHPIYVLRNYNKLASLPSTSSSFELDAVSQLHNIFNNLPSNIATSQLYSLLNNLVRMKCSTRTKKKKNKDTTTKQNNITKRLKSELATALHVRAIRSQQTNQLKESCELLLEAIIIDRCGSNTHVAIDRWSMLGIMVNTLLKTFAFTQDSILGHEKMYFFKFPLQMEAAQLGINPQSRKWKKARTLQRVICRIHKKVIDLKRIQNIQKTKENKTFKKTFRMQLVDDYNYIEWASLLVSTGTNIKNGLKILKQRCNDNNDNDIDNKILKLLPRGSACYYLGNAYYRVLGKVIQGKLAYDKAWMYHEKDRLKSLETWRGNGNLKTMQEATLIRIQLLAELPNIALNRGQSYVVNGEYQEARSIWEEGVRRNYFIHYMQHGNTNLRPGLTTIPFWTDNINNLPNIIQKNVFQKYINTLGLSVWKDISHEIITNIKASNKLWVPSDNLYFRDLYNLTTSDDDTNQIKAQWKQIHLRNGTDNTENQKKKKKVSSACKRLPLLCSIINKIIKKSKGIILNDAKISSLWCKKCEIIPHCGVTNNRLRIMIPILIPNDATFELYVGGEKKLMDDSSIGKPLVFDDSIEHTVKYENGGGESGGKNAVVLPRLVLLMNMKHPDML